MRLGKVTVTRTVTASLRRARKKGGPSQEKYHQRQKDASRSPFLGRDNNRNEKE